SRQALELNFFLGHRKPSAEMVVIREKVHYRLVGLVNVFLLAGECDPAKRSLAFAEQRPNIRRNESGIRERVENPVIEGALPQIIPVVEDNSTALLKLKHRFDVARH